MKAPRIVLIAAAVVALHWPHAQAQVFNTKSYQLLVHGTSSLHDWESRVEKAEFSGSFKLENDVLIDVKNVVVNIPVKSIKSTKGKMMDNKTWDAFNHEKNPSITFVMTDHTINTQKRTIDVSGNLTMAGVTKPIEFALAYKILSDGDVQFTSTKTINMTHFKMEPPTAMMGTIKVGSDIRISLQLVINNTETL